MRPTLTLILPICFVACATPRKGANRYEGDPAAISDQYSLAADRSKLEELRKDIPVETRLKNDEEAVILQLTSELKKEPSDIRRVFDDMMRKKRDLIDKNLTKERKEFTKKESSERDVFLKAQEKSRNDFNKTSSRAKPSKEQRTDFYNTQDEARKEFFANERERRNEFESVVREKRKDFEDYARSRINDFNQEMRVYSKNLEDKKKAEREAKKIETNP